ncbi:MAG: hypothetical protein JOY77_02120 [Alphaproteobacteria bacterium]|nr:hypothetical protein [Alphaproteobacteria bacterium]MBV9061709.1 hypothetical protein [Alphaproteobacteria bacterium]MBV9914848.1 hypothetical protein [Nevskiaceae bacterium]
MKRSFLLAAGFVMATASAASANSVQYTFADTDGNPYCDGVQLDINNGVAVGVHTNGAQCTEGDYAGGLAVKMSGSKDKRLVITTTDVNNLSPGMVETYMIDTSDMSWQVYDENTNDVFPFQLVNEGVLLKGNPPAGRGHRGVSGLKKS